MRTQYPFLKDQLALMEIRKHKWLESEKLGREIGFATAAVDWVNRYGNDWKQFRLKSSAHQNLFSEKRQYRRFSHKLPVQLTIEGQTFNTITTTMSLIGFTCLLPYFKSAHSPVEARLSLPVNAEGFRQPLFQFKTIISHNLEIHNHEKGPFYTAFLPFNEETRNYLRTHGNAVFSQTSANV